MTATNAAMAGRLRRLTTDMTVDIPFSITYTLFVW
jgi:hypothetical protein